MKIKLIAVDLDGTLLTSRKKVSPKTLATLKKAREKGILVVPLSGRPLPGVLKVFEAGSGRQLCYLLQWRPGPADGRGSPKRQPLD